MLNIELINLWYFGLFLAVALRFFEALCGVVWNWVAYSGDNWTAWGEYKDEKIEDFGEFCIGDGVDFI